jgi:CheY-like chemotaxis protein
MSAAHNHLASILVVEDDIDIRSALVQILRMEGHTTAEAANGKEALEYIRNNPKPCMVLLDMMMPIMTGRQFLDVFKNEPDSSSVPVVIISAVADRIDTSGAKEFIRKPLEVSKLLEVIAKYC